MVYKYLKEPIEKYLRDLAAKTPAPGGGAAAALSAAMAVSLLSMVCQFSIGKQRYKPHQARLKTILKKSLFLQKRLSELVDEDVRAYRNKDLKKSIAVPAEVCFLSSEIVKSGYELFQKGNCCLTTDTALAVFLAEASFIACFGFLRYNLNSLPPEADIDRKFLKRLSSLRRKARETRRKIERELERSFRR